MSCDIVVEAKKDSDPPKHYYFNPEDPLILRRECDMDYGMGDISVDSWIEKFFRSQNAQACSRLLKGLHAIAQQKKDHAQKWLAWSKENDLEKSSDGVFIMDDNDE